MIDLAKLTTESRNPRTMNLDEMSPLQLVSVMNQEDLCVVSAVKTVLPQVAIAVQWAKEAFEVGGRLIYFGAGTSGRLGVLDAVECPPTFGVSSDVVVGLIAGGERAFVRAVEGAEDDPELCKKELIAINLKESDLAVGLAASGRTPYVIGGLRYAKEIGCRTVAIACNKNSAIGKEADLAIEPTPGPEVLTGSTRLKAGTAQKMILNMISTGSMVGIGKAYQNLMVDVQQTNNKLVVRAQNITMAATGCARDEAAAALHEANGSAKVAIVMLLTKVSAKEAQNQLDAAQGHVRDAL
ncbi:N-acetylmuramic acid 6-phosphate etherase [Atopobium sp. oral taxon 199]|uniref:N-acetylmuramic acid 6-phosphate etherase n=1 Tax=Atopobium sp. oral taxon 199 TaxID=712156 RepID=UPI00034EA5CD|nr:N-acetylmuramic acid 6-phosphate etherase [Atopobium sp. oral taxon 199]EPD77756.1 N-acetylmuramic acid 6-phosphate etherase [Atopobium sp. oral taxon 199 str. F0494]